MSNILHDLKEEIKRVEEIVGIYEETPGGNIAASLMRKDIELAKKSIMDNDVITMILLYKELKEWKL